MSSKINFSCDTCIHEKNPMYVGACKDCKIGVKVGSNHVEKPTRFWFCPRRNRYYDYNMCAYCHEERWILCPL